MSYLWNIFGSFLSRSSKSRRGWKAVQSADDRRARRAAKRRWHEPSTSSYWSILEGTTQGFLVHAEKWRWTKRRRKRKKRFVKIWQSLFQRAMNVWGAESRNHTSQVTVRHVRWESTPAKIDNTHSGYFGVHLNEDVLSLDVPVEDALWVHVAGRIHHLLQDHLRKTETQFEGTGSVFQTQQ